MAYANESYFENKVYEASLRSKREKEEFHLHSQSSKALSSLNQRFGEKLKLVHDNAEKRRREICSRRDSERRKKTEKIRDFENKIKFDAKEKRGLFTIFGGVIGGILGAYHGILDESFMVFLLYTVLGNVAGNALARLFFLRYQIKINSLTHEIEQIEAQAQQELDAVTHQEKEDKKPIENELNQARSEEEKRYRKASKDCGDKYSAAYIDYKKQVKRICQDYITQYNQGDNRRPIYDWLLGVMKDAIENADRSAYLEKLDVMVYLRFSALGVNATRRLGPKSDQYGSRVVETGIEEEELPPFSFMQARMSSPVHSDDEYTAMCELAGYAAFIGLLFEGVLPKAFPKDPKAPEGMPDGCLAKAFFVNGDTVILGYSAPNAFYTPEIRT